MNYWYVKGLNLKTASIRYRMLQPIKYFELKSIPYRIMVSDSKMKTNVNSDCTSIIFVKTYCEADIILARNAFLEGIPVFLDLCDNLFIEGYSFKNKNKIRPIDWFFEISQYCSGIITPTEYLKRKVIEKLTHKVPIYVISDPVENLVDIRIFERVLEKNEKFQTVHKSNLKKQVLKLVARNRFGYLLLKVLEKLGVFNFLSKTSVIQPILLKEFHRRRQLAWNQIRERKLNRLKQLPGKKVLWFGSHGQGEEKYGMYALLMVKDALRELSKNHDLRLIVCSNNEVKFNSIADSLGIRSEYIEWDPSVVYRLLDFSDVLILPNHFDEYNCSKSPNRAVLGLSCGTPVIVSDFDIYTPLKEYLLIENWEENINKVLKEEYTIPEKKIVREVIDNNYSGEAFGEKLISILKQKANSSLYGEGNDIVVYIQMIQDFYLFENLLIELREQKRSLKVYVDLKVLIENQQLIAPFFDQRDIKYVAMKQSLAWKEDYPFFENAKYFLSGSESNLPPHKTAYKLTEIANRQGVQTFTFQHGIENIGLNYSHKSFKAPVEFASDRVFTWSTENPVCVSPEKLVVLGTFKRPRSKQNLKKKLDLCNTKVISIFENLHWDRYSEDYRDKFLAFLSEATEKNPDFLFFLKPHPAGRWFDQRANISLEKKNFKLVTKENFPEISGAQDLISISDLVLSTPSTVCLDAAIDGAKVGLLSFGDKFEFYSELEQVSNCSDLDRMLKNFSWETIENFKSSSIKSEDVAKFFVEKYLPPT